MNLAGVEIGSVSSWLTAGGVVALIGVVLGFIIKMRAADFQGWGNLIEALQGDIANVREEHRKCQADLAQIRNELSGLQRMVIAQSSVRAIPLSQQSPVIREAAERSAAAVLRDIERNETGNGEGGK